MFVSERVSVVLLRDEAQQHGDIKMVALCDRALKSSYDEGAWREVRRTLELVTKLREEYLAP